MIFWTAIRVASNVISYSEGGLIRVATLRHPTDSFFFLLKKILCLCVRVRSSCLTGCRRQGQCVSGDTLSTDTLSNRWRLCSFNIRAVRRGFALTSCSRMFRERCEVLFAFPARHICGVVWQAPQRHGTVLSTLTQYINNFCYIFCWCLCLVAID